MPDFAPTLTPEERVRIRGHLGYANVAGRYVLTFGHPASVEANFYIEGAMDRVLVDSLAYVRTLLARCDATEGQMFENTENQAVESLGSIKINKDEFEQLRRGPYEFWRRKLAATLGVLPNPYDPNDMGGGGLNVPVING